MNVQELRTALHEHAGQVDDIGTPARVAATHERVVAVRRHRRAGVAAAVAAAVIAVVAAGSLTLLPRHQDVQPAEHTPPAKLAGYKVARTYHVAPWTFRYVRGVQSARGQSVLDLDVPASDRPRVIGWGVATHGFSSRAATLSVDGHVVGSSGDGLWSTGDLLSPGRAHRLTVRFKKPSPTNRSGVAIYDLVGQPPAGATNGLSVFRQDIVGDRLLGAAFGKPGQRSVSFDVTAPDTRVSFSTMCSGVPRDVMSSLTVNGSPVEESSCASTPLLDPGKDRVGPGSAGWAASLGIEPGATLHVTLELRGHHRVDTDHLVLGVAAYHDAPAVTHVAGWDIPELVEGPDGHVYHYADSTQSRPGERRVVLHVAASPHQRLVQYATAHLRGVTDLRINGRTVEENQSAAGGGGFGSGQVLSPERAYTVSMVVRRGLNPRTQLGLVVSTRTD